MLPGPASQRGAGRAGREGTAAGAAEAKYAFLLLPCARGAAGGSGPGGPGSAAPSPRRRPPARPGSRAPQPPPPPPLCAATMQQSAAAARAPSPRPPPAPSRLAASRARGASPRPGLGGVAAAGARSLELARPAPAGLPCVQPHGRDFSPFPRPAIFWRGGRGGEGARRVPGRAVRSGATFLARPARHGSPPSTRPGRGAWPGPSPALRGRPELGASGWRGWRAAPSQS